MLKSPESVRGDRRPRCSQGLSCAFNVTLLGEAWQCGHEPHLQDGTCVQRLPFRRQRAPCLAMGPLLQSKRGRDWEANPLTDKRQTSLIHKSTHSVCPAQTHLEASGRRAWPLTTLGGVSQVLECGHGGLCPLNVLFSFRDVQILRGGLLGSFCCWLHKHKIPE